MRDTLPAYTDLVPDGANGYIAIADPLHGNEIARAEIAGDAPARATIGAGPALGRGAAIRARSRGP